MLRSYDVNPSGLVCGRTAIRVVVPVNSGEIAVIHVAETVSGTGTPALSSARRDPVPVGGGEEQVRTEARVRTCSSLSRHYAVIGWKLCDCKSCREGEMCFVFCIVI